MIIGGFPGRYSGRYLAHNRLMRSSDDPALTVLMILMVFPAKVTGAAAGAGLAVGVGEGVDVPSAFGTTGGADWDVGAGVGAGPQASNRITTRQSEIGKPNFPGTVICISLV